MDQRCSYSRRRRGAYFGHIITMNNKKIAIVTGAGTGLGAAIGRSLGKLGFSVGLHYNKSKDSATEMQKTLTDSFLIQGDLSTQEGCDAIYDIIKKDHNGQLDVLVNNAGIAHDNPIFSSNLGEFESTINLNMKSVWYLTKRLARFMIRQKQGRVINISSVVAHIANPTQSVYSMTKAAIESFTRVAAYEFANYNILVNAIAPGFIETKMTEHMPQEFKDKILDNIPLNRMGTPSEIGDVAGFLAASGSYITGSVIHVNGGLYCG